MAPADAPLHLLPIPKAAGDSEVDENNNAKDVRIHDHINNLQFSISPTAFFQVRIAIIFLHCFEGNFFPLYMEF